MGKKFNKFLSVILALVISSSSVIAVSADTVEIQASDVSAEPYTFKWTEETQTKEFEVKSNVLGETDDEAIPKENGNANEKAKEESFSPQRENPENKINQEDTAQQVQTEKVTPENSGAVNTTAAAGDTEIQSGTSGDLTWKYDGDTKTLTISGEGDMGSYSSYGSYAPWKDKDIENAVIEKGAVNISKRAFYYCKGLKSITIPDSVTCIGEEAFYECKSLTSVTLPNSVTSIGDLAFGHCTGLTSITIPDSVTSIEDSSSYCSEYGAFYGCTGLTSVKISNSLKKIGNGTFRGCTGLKSVTIPNSVTSIGKSAFEDCTGLTSITIPNSVTSIGKSAFEDCTGLTNVTIPNSLKRIEAYTFSQCYKLTDITIPNSVTSIGNCAFEECTSLTSITIPDSVLTIGDYIPYYDSNDYLKYHYSGYDDIGAFSYCTGLTSVKISNSLKRIEYGTFYKCISLTSVTIPNSVTSIGNSAFYGCKGLTSVKIPNSVKSIEKEAFCDCENLTSITIPSSVETLSGFKNCKGLTSVTIPNSVTSIGERAFIWCTNLKSVTMPKSLTSIGNCAFSMCSALTDITIPNTVTSIGEEAFYECKALTSITIPNSVTSIGKRAFESCGLTSITIPDSITTIPERAFFYCSNLTSITIPNSVTSIENSAFGSCKGLTSITIPDSVTDLSGFGGCTGLTSVTIPQSVTSIGDGAFAYCIGLTSVTISDSVTSIGDSAFARCTGLTNVTIPDSVTFIGDDAFNNCTGLTSITIPDSVTIIGHLGNYHHNSSSCYNGAFFNCTGLKSVKLSNSLQKIGYGTFCQCTGLTNITIPDSVTDICGYAFSECTGLTSVTIPNSVTDIASYAFFKCTGLKNLTLSDSLTSIQHSVFYYCTSLTNLTIPNSVTEINSYAFSKCTDLTSVIIPDSVKSIDDGAFDECTSLTSITFPNSIEKLSGFSNCTGLTSITIPDSVKTLKGFYNCTGLTSIIIPASVTSISDGCFTHCSEELTIYCPPEAYYVQEYAKNKNINFKISLTGYSTANIAVNVSDAYKGLYLKLYSAVSNRLVCTRIIDKNVVSIYGINDALTYRAEIVSDTGSVFGTIDNIKFDDDDFLEITFSDTKPICSISAVVKDDQDSDVTNQCTVTWYSEDGKYLKTGKTLRNVAQDDVYKYSVTFISNNLTENFAVPAEQTVKVESEKTKAECLLKMIPSVTLSGKAVDTDGNAIKNVSISLTQTIDKKNIKTLTTLTDSDGCFTLNAKNVSSSFTVRKAGYEVYSENINDFTENEKTITLKKIETANVTLNITKQDIDSSEEELQSADDITFVLKNKTTGKKIQGFSVTYPTLVLPLNEVSDNNEIVIKASADDYLPTETSFIFAEDSSVSLQLVQQGRLELVQQTADTYKNMALIFDNNGNYVDTLNMSTRKTTSDSLAEGDYTVIMMNKNYRYYSPSTLKEFNSYQLEENKDYVKSEVKIENAKTTTVDSVSVPTISENKSSYLNLEKTSISVNKSSVPLGQFIIINLDYSFDEDVDVSDIKINLSVPNNLLLSQNCVTVNNKILVYTNDNGNISIPTEELSGTARIALRAAHSTELCNVSANISFISNDTPITESVGSLSCSIKDFELYVPDKVNTTTIYSNGTTTPNTVVEYYDNDVLVGTTKSNKAGSFEIEFELYMPFNRSTHEIYAAVTAPNGDLLKTSKRTLEYACDNIVPKQLNVYWDSHNDNVMSIYFNKKQESGFYYYFNPKIPTFTYELEFEGDISKITSAEVITKTQNDETISIPLTLDEASGKMIGSYDYTTETRPSFISVSYSVNQEYVFDYEEMLYACEDLSAIPEKIEASMNEYEKAVKALNDFENSSSLKEELKNTLKEAGLSDEDIKRFDISAIIKEASEEVDSEAEKAYQEYMEENKELFDEYQKKLDSLEDIEEPARGSFTRIDNNVTSDSLIKQGYVPVKQYGSKNVIFERGNDSNQYNYINLNQRFGVKYPESSDPLPTPTPKPDPTPDPTPKPDPTPTPTPKPDPTPDPTPKPDPTPDPTPKPDPKSCNKCEEGANGGCKTPPEVESFLSFFCDFYNNKHALLMKTLRGAVEMATLGAEHNFLCVDYWINKFDKSINATNRQVLDSLDKLNSAAAVGNRSNTDKYGQQLLKLLAESKKYSLLKDLMQRTKSVLGACNVAGWVMDALDLLNYGLKIKEVAKQICKCSLPEALDCVRAAKEYLASAIILYMEDIGIQIATSKNLMLSLGYGSLKNYSDAGYSIISDYLNWETEMDWQQKLQPITYDKRMIDFCLKQAKEIMKQKCKCCHKKGDPNGDPNGHPLRSAVDPSGYVCEAVPSNRVEGVTTTLYYSPYSSGEYAVVWDASEYDQKNPLLSNSDGHYEWYVPNGWWQVKFEKEGYETTYSEWVPVLPIQTEINVAMKSLYAPTVKYVNVYSNSADITFSQYMDIETVNTDTVTLFAGGKQITGTIEPVNPETSFADKNVQYASKFRFVPETALSGDVTVKVENVKSYNGLYIDSAYTADKTVAERIETIDVPEKIQMKYNESTDIDIQLLPESAAADVEVKVTSSNNRLLSVSSDTVTTDKNGKATVTITGKLPSNVEIYFNIESLGLSAFTTVELSMPKADNSDPHTGTDPDNKTETPDTPDTPDKPNNPDKPDKPDNPDNPDKPDNKDPIEKTVIFGDVDGDGKITSADSLSVLRRGVNLEKYTDEQEMLADVDGDGKITSADALFILRCSVGLKDSTKAGETIVLKVM